MKTCNGGRNVVINTKVTIVRETNDKTEHFIQIGYCYLLKSGPVSSRRRKNSVLNLYFRPEYIDTQIKYVCCSCFLFNIWLIARPRYHEKKKSARYHGNNEKREQLSTTSVLQEQGEKARERGLCQVRISICSNWFIVCGSVYMVEGKTITKSITEDYWKVTQGTNFPIETLNRLLPHTPGTSHPATAPITKLKEPYNL